MLWGARTSSSLSLLSQSSSSSALSQSPSAASTYSRRQ